MENRYRYLISGTVLGLGKLNSLSSVQRVLLTEYIREHAGENVEINSYNFDEIVTRRPPSAKQTFDRMMLALCRRANFQAGAVLVKKPQHSQLYQILRECGVGAEAQLRALASYAEERGFASSEVTGDSFRINLKIPGIIYAEDLQREWSESLDAFVAMWFSGELLAAYDEGIAPAITDCGFTPVRVDRSEFNHKIDDEIIAAIRRARFVIADFSCGETGARGGVYFEAGFGLALDKQVIFTVRQQDLERVHFDTRQFKHIVWTDPQDLRRQLVNRIGATIPLHPQASRAAAAPKP